MVKGRIPTCQQKKTMLHQGQNAENLETITEYASPACNMREWETLFFGESVKLGTNGLPLTSEGLVDQEKSVERDRNMVTRIPVLSKNEPK
jgi:hypothetical protein